MGFPGDSEADLHRDTRAVLEGDLQTDSCGDSGSDFPADWYRDSDADLRRDSQEDFRCGFDGDLRDTGQLLASRFVCRRDPFSASGRQREKGSRVQGFKGSRVRAQGEAPPRGCATHRRNERGDAPGRLRHHARARPESVRRLHYYRQVTAICGATGRDVLTRVCRGLEYMWERRCARCATFPIGKYMIMYGTDHADRK